MASDTSISRRSEGLARRLTGAMAPMSVVVAGFLVGIGAAASIATHFYLVGLAFFLVNRASILATLSAEHAAHARRALGAIALAAMPFGFALADMTHALAASFLLIGLLAQTATARAGDDGANTLSGVSTTLAIVIACIRPDWFGIAAYVAGVLGFAAAGLALGTSSGDAPP